MSPHLIVELKSLHVHNSRNPWRHSNLPASSPGVMSKITFLETIKSRIQNRDPLLLTRATPTSSTQCSHPLFPGSTVCHPEPGFPFVSLTPSLFLLPILPLLSTPQPSFLWLALKRCFLFQDAFLHPALGCLELGAVLTPTALCSLSELPVSPHHPNSLFRAGTTLLPSHPVPSPEFPSSLLG